MFIGRNYGEAAALDIYGQALGGPPAISGHNNYYLWGLQGHDGSVLIVLGRDPAKYAPYYGSVEAAGTIDTPYAMPYETGLTIFVLRQPKVSLATVWPKLKHYE